MSTTEKQTWETVRSQGKNTFIIHGIWHRGLKVALPCMIGFLLMDMTTHQITNILSEIEFLAIGYVIMSLAAGWCEGEIIWFRTERDYHRLMLQTEEQAV
jgi:hypothetical protein